MYLLINEEKVFDKYNEFLETFSNMIKKYLIVNLYEIKKYLEPEL